MKNVIHILRGLDFKGPEKLIGFVIQPVLQIGKNFNKNKFFNSSQSGRLF